MRRMAIQRARNPLRRGGWAVGGQGQVGGVHLPPAAIGEFNPGLAFTQFPQADLRGKGDFLDERAARIAGFGQNRRDDGCAGGLVGLHFRFAARVQGAGVNPAGVAIVEDVHTRPVFAWFENPHGFAQPQLADALGVQPRPAPQVFPPGG